MSPLFLYLRKTHSDNISLITVNKLRTFLIKPCNFYNDGPLHSTRLSAKLSNDNYIKKNYIKIGEMVEQEIAGKGKV